jgi:epsilon-lactone hydrolase
VRQADLRRIDRIAIVRVPRPPGDAVASTEFHALQAHLAAQPAAPPPATLDDLRASIDARLGALPLAEGTKAEEVSLAGRTVWRCTREGGDGDPVLLYLHGGGFRIGSALAWRSYGTHLAKACSARVDVLDYRLAPEHPFPAALDDVVNAYGELLDDGIAPGRIFIGGDSAGGGLTASALVAIRERGLAQPAGGVCLSPWADLRVVNRSYDTSASLDMLFGRPQAEAARALYIGDRDPTDPLVSPVLADWTGLAPLLVHVGDRESLLDDALALTHAARAAGVDVTLEVFPEMPHVWHMSYPAFPEAVHAVEQVAAFIASRAAG